MRTVLFLIFSLILPKFSLAATTFDARNSEDHPLIGRYPGFMIKKYQQYEYDEVAIMTGKFDAQTKTAPILEFEAKVTNILYENSDPDPKVSELQLYKNYENALKKLNAEFLLNCKRTDCVINIPAKSYKINSEIGNWIRSNRKIFRGLHGNRGPSTNDSAIITAKIIKNNKPIYIMLIVDSYHPKNRHIFVSIIEPAKLDTNLIEVGNLENIEETLNQKGSVVLDGIYFDHDKSVVKNESKKSMVKIADYLKNHPQKSFFVVGHTDNSGSYSHNLSLSQDRAKAVIEYLSVHYNINPTRLQAIGIGPVSPAANNNSEQGKTINRRVELVLSNPSETIQTISSDTVSLKGTYAPDLTNISDPKIKAMANSMPRLSFHNDGKFEVHMNGTLVSEGNYQIKNKELTMVLENFPQKAILNDDNTRFVFADGEKQGYVKLQ